MRPPLRLAARAALLAALLVGAGACGPAGSLGARSPRGPVILRGEPSCIYRIMGEVRQPIDATIPPEVGIRAKTRALGADAVIEGIPELQRNERGQIVARIWVGTAVAFSDPENPDCYR